MGGLGPDGNAAAGSLREVFSFGVTTAEHPYEGCGRAGRLGSDSLRVSSKHCAATVQQPERKTTAFGVKATYAYMADLAYL